MIDKNLFVTMLRHIFTVIEIDKKCVNTEKKKTNKLNPIKKLITSNEKRKEGAKKKMRECKWKQSE